MKSCGDTSSAVWRINTNWRLEMKKYFENIRVFGERKPRFVFLGLDPEHGVKNATLENVVVGDQKLSAENGLLPVVQNEFVSDLEIK